MFRPLATDDPNWYAFDDGDAFIAEVESACGDVYEIVVDRKGIGVIHSATVGEDGLMYLVFEDIGDAEMRFEAVLSIAFETLRLTKKYANEPAMLVARLRELGFVR